MPDSSLPIPPDDDREDVRRWRYLVRESMGRGGGGVGVVDITGTRGQHPDDIPEDPDAADDEFEGSTLDTTGERSNGATPWEWHNQSDATATLTQGHLVLTDPGSATTNIEVIRQAAPSGAWVYRMKFTDFISANTDFSGAGIILQNNTNTKCVLFVKDRTGNFDISVDRHDDLGSGPSTSLGGIDNFFSTWDVRLPIYFEVESDGTTLYFRYSGSGVNGSFVTLLSETIATHLGTVDYIGLTASSANSSDVTMVVEWFRRME